MKHLDPPALALQQSPARRQFLDRHQVRHSQVKPFAPQANFRLGTKGFSPVGQEVSTRDLALDDYRMLGPLPPNGIGHFPAGAGLLRKDDATAVTPQPGDRFLNKLGVGHRIQIPGDAKSRRMKSIGFPLTFTLPNAWPRVALSLLPLVTCVTTCRGDTGFTLDGETMSLPSQEAGRARGASAVAFVHSLNILIKYSRMYGFDHKRTESAFETTWKELQASLPVAGTGGLLLGVNGNRILLDGLPLDTGQAERSFAQLLSAAGLASIHFAPNVSDEDLARLVRAFALGGSKAQDLTKQMKESLAGCERIRVNEVKFVAADPLTGDVSVAAQIAAQTLGPEFRDWLNDPQKLLQLIAASEGANRGGGGSGPGVVPGSVPMGPGGAGPGGPGGAPGGGGAYAFGSSGGFAGGNGGPGGGSFVAGLAGATGAAGTATAIAYGNTVPLQEEEVVQAIRLLTQFGEASKTSNPKIDSLQQEIEATSPNARLNLQGLLSNLAATVGNQETDSNMLMKAAEHMAIKFALEKYQKGDIRVNAVHQMLEHMSRQMERLRQILRLQEDKMGKAGILVESHADIMDRMFWAEVPDSGKRSVLLSNEAACV